jgi:hypothetical protein
MNSIWNKLAQYKVEKRINERIKEIKHKKEYYTKAMNEGYNFSPQEHKYYQQFTQDVIITELEEMKKLLCNPENPLV